MLQGQNFTASVSKNNVAIGEQFKLSFNLDAKAERFQAPDLSKFRVFSGPNQSTSMKWVNGVVSNSTSYNYILAAKQEGKFIIGPAEVQFENQSLRSNPIEIVVSAQTQQQNPANNNPQASASAPNTGNEMDKNVFLRVQVSNANPYEGEQIVVTYKLYYRIDVINIEAEKLPSFKGFSSYDIQVKNSNLPQEVMGGIRYNVAGIQQMVLFPQRAGELEIDALELKTIVRVAAQRRPRSIFDQFFGSYQDIEHRCKSQNLKIQVKALPSKGKPANFKGAVGSYTFTSEIDKDSLGANEALNLSSVISGKGDINLLPEPQFKFPVDFEVYDPKTNVSSTASSAGINGKKSFEYLVIPRHSGVFEIRSEGFSYFDPIKATYVTIPAKSYKIKVGKVDAEEMNTFRASKKEDIKFLGKDIRYINTQSSDLENPDEIFFRSRNFWLLILLAPLLFLIAHLFTRRMIRNGKDMAGLRKKKAKAIAEKHLAEAGKALKSNSDKLYEELSIALNGYLSDKLGFSKAELNRSTIKEELGKRNVSAESISSLHEIMELCDMARFAPGVAGDKAKLFERSKKMIHQLESELS